MFLRPIFFSILFIATNNQSIWAQFEVLKVEIKESYIINSTETTEMSHLFYLSSSKDSAVAQRINNSLYLELFGTSFDRKKLFGDLFPNTDKHGSKHKYEYQILENSDRFFTFHISYQRPTKELRSHRYYTFISETGELKKMWNLIDEDPFYEIADRAFKIYATHLNNYIKLMDTSDVEIKRQHDILVECANFYFDQPYRFEYGFIYLMSDGVHCVNPPCPQHYGAHDKKDWFTCKFSYDDFKPYFTERMITYGKTGVWTYTLNELLINAPVHNGTINGNEAELILVQKDSMLKGKIHIDKTDKTYHISVRIDKKKVYMEPLTGNGNTSKLKLKNGVLSGVYNVSETEKLEVKFSYNSDATN